MITISNLSLDVQDEKISHLNFKELSSLIKDEPLIQMNEDLWLRVVNSNHIDVSDETDISYYNLYIRYLILKEKEDNKIWIAQLKDPEEEDEDPVVILSFTYDIMLRKLSKKYLSCINLTRSYDPTLESCVNYPIYKWLANHGFDQKNLSKIKKTNNESYKKIIYSSLSHDDCVFLHNLVYEYFKSITRSDIETCFKLSDYQLYIYQTNANL